MFGSYTVFAPVRKDLLDRLLSWKMLRGEETLQEGAKDPLERLLYVSLTCLPVKWAFYWVLMETGYLLLFFRILGSSF